MKNTLLTVFLFAVALSACHKDPMVNGLPPKLPLPEDSGCMNRLVIPVTSHGTLSDSVYTLVNNLFITNGVYNVNFRYNRVNDDSLQDYDGLNDYRSVYTVQYVNGLPDFGESLIYVFKNSKLHYTSGNIINGANLDTTSMLTPGQLRKLFIDDIQQFDNKGQLYKDSCFNAEFGYYDLSINTGSSTPNLVKAWHVTTKGSNYPEAYYQDGTGQRIGYNDGIVDKKGK